MGDIYRDLNEDDKIVLRDYLIFKLESGAIIKKSKIIPNRLLRDHVLIAIEDNIPKAVKTYLGDAGNVLSELIIIVSRAFLYYEESYAIGDKLVSDKYISKKFKIGLAENIPDFLDGCN